MAILTECPTCHKKQKVQRKKCSKCDSNMIRAPLAVLDDEGMPDKEKLEEYGKPADFSKCTRFWINYTLPATRKQKREFAGYGYEIAKTAESKRRVQKCYHRSRVDPP